MNVSLKWKATKADDSVVNQFDGESENAFNLDFETVGFLKKFELLDSEDNVKVMVDLVNGDIKINDTTYQPASGQSDYMLRFKRRTQIRSNQGQILSPARVKYLFGFKVGSDTYLGSIRPVLEQLAEEVEAPSKQ